MVKENKFQRRGVVEGFFGSPWSMAQRKRLFEFGAPRGMNTFLYAPKDDPYHRKLWRHPYPRQQWQELVRLIRQAQKNHIDFVYGFHPGEGLCFSESEPIDTLLKKARCFYDAGVRTFAVLFDDIPSRLSNPRDRRRFKQSLAAAEGDFLRRILQAQPSAWSHVEWWICPSYYSEDPLLERVFGAFEANFLDTLALHLPPQVACFWTGPAVVSKTITMKHMRKIAGRLKRPLLLWDNYPVNDLSMADELHIGPLTGRAPRLPRLVYGYLTNPLLQPALGYLPLATCFEYAAHPQRYRAEASWKRSAEQCFGRQALAHWRAIRKFSLASMAAKTRERRLRLGAADAKRIAAALRYVGRHKKTAWARELTPWAEQMDHAIRSPSSGLSSPAFCAK